MALMTRILLLVLVCFISGSRSLLTTEKKQDSKHKEGQVSSRPRSAANIRDPLAAEGPASTAFGMPSALRMLMTLLVAFNLPAAERQLASRGHGFPVKKFTGGHAKLHPYSLMKRAAAMMCDDTVAMPSKRRTLDGLKEVEEKRLLPLKCAELSVSHASCRRTFLGHSLSAVAATPLAAAALMNGPRPAIAKSASVASATGSVAGATVTTEFVSGLIAGAAQKTVKEIFLHPFDTVKTRLQVAGGSRSLFESSLYDGVYSGIGPAVISGAPAASLFFAVKDAVKQQLTKQLGDTLGNIVAVGAANVPYWLVRNPTEVIKSRRQVGQVEDAREATSKLWQEQGASGFYRGYASNLAYAFPVDATKFVIYDAIKKELKARNGGKKLSTLESAAFGAVSSAIAQGVSTPLDVTRTKIMTAPAEQKAAGVFPVLADVASTEGIKGLYAGISPKLVRAVASGALQFSVLEGVKDAINDALIGALAPKPR